MNSNSHIRTTVQPAHLKFLGWKPIILPIDERQRHLSISGTYIDGQKRYLGYILTQDIDHIKYTEAFGHLVPKFEHSQLIDQLIFIGSKNSFLSHLIKKETIKKDIQSVHQVKTINQKKKSFREEKTLDFEKALITKHILYFEFDDSSPKESIEIIEKMIKTIFENSFRESFFSYSLVIEDVDFYIQTSIEFAKYYRKLSRDSRKNQCTISISYQNLESYLLKGFKNHLEINQGNEGKAELTRCGHKDKFHFMPFAPVELL